MFSVLFVLLTSSPGHCVQYISQTYINSPFQTVAWQTHLSPAQCSRQQTPPASVPSPPSVPLLVRASASKRGGNKIISSLFRVALIMMQYHPKRPYQTVDIISTVDCWIGTTIFNSKRGLGESGYH